MNPILDYIAHDAMVQIVFLIVIALVIALTIIRRSLFKFKLYEVAQREQEHKWAIELRREEALKIQHGKPKQTQGVTYDQSSS